MVTRRGFLAGSAIALAGCLGTGAEAEGEVGEGGIPVRDPHETGTSLSDYADETLRGSSQDGIPSIDSPVYVSPDEVGLDDGDPVFGLVRDGEARAYPQEILVLHEIVNDTIAGDDLAVTYCPLTGTAMGFERGDAEFGVSGRLVNSNLVMYDRATGSWWGQIPGASIDGPHTENGLEEFRLFWADWGDWRAEYPDTEVLSRETGYARNYDREVYGIYNPRTGYYENEDLLFSPLERDDRFQPKKMFTCVRDGEAAAAFSNETMRDEKVASLESAGREYVAFHDDSLDAVYVYRGDGDGVEYDGARFTDGTETWDADDPPDRFDRVYAFGCMWFAWYAYYPHTEVHA